MKLLTKLINEFLSPPKPSAPQKTPPATKIPCEPHKQNNSSSKTIKHKVAGVAHYKDNLLRLARPNPQYSLSKNEMYEKDIPVVYEYEFITRKTELIPEPTNQYDPNAIKVLIDGMHVGYIKKGSCKHILNLLNQNQIEKIDSKINGGNCKGFDLDGSGNLKFGQGVNEYSVTVFITER